MKKCLFALTFALALPFVLLAANSTPKGFTDDLDAALAAAKAKGKFVYACFSGSDWCGWCVRLEKEVFSDATFVETLKNDYEFVFIDSPRDTNLLSEAAKTRNPVLTKKYGIRGFPSMIIFDGADGSEIVRASAYRRGGASAYIDYLKEFRTKGAPALRQEKALEAEWVTPLNQKLENLFKDLNTACGKYVETELAKPDNKKTREELRAETIKVVRDFLPKFNELQVESANHAAAAPEAIKPQVVEFAKSLAEWIQKIGEQK